MDDESRERLRFRPLSGDMPSNDVVMDAENNQFGGGSADVGSLLRATRTGLGQSVEDVCQMLRIRKIYIEAIENGDYSVLPNGPYGLGFVKAYAEHLGLDGAEMIRRFREESNAPAVRSELSFPKPVQESRVPGGAVLLIAVMLGLGAYGGWYYLSSQGKTIADLVDPLPERLASYSTMANEQSEPRNLENAAEARAAEAEVPVTSPAASETAVTGASDAPVAATEETVAQEPVVEPQAAPAAELAETNEAPAPVVAEEPAAAEPVVTETAEAPEATPAPVATQTAPAATPAPAPAAPSAEVASVPAAPDVDDAGGARVFGAVNVDSRVTISAVETSWVRIREADGNVLLTRMLTAGDTYKVPNRDGLKLEVGNAGALTYSIDGAEAKPVGNYGAVISDFSLDVDDLSAIGQTTVQ